MNTEFVYADRISSLIGKTIEANSDNIEKCAKLFAENMMNDRLIHVFGSGHSAMLAMEMFSRAGGLANINPIFDPDALTIYGSRRSGEMERLSGLADVIYDNYNISKDDIMIISSNSGRNPLIVEMALRCRKEGVTVVGVTSIEESKKTTSRHESGKLLYELCNILLDNCSPGGDICVDVDGMETGPVSSVTTLVLMNTIVTEAVKIMNDAGFKPFLFQSQNKDGADNVGSYLHYYRRIRSL